MKSFLFLTGLLIFSGITAFSFSGGDKDGHQIRFYKIDNQVKVFVNDKSVFESDVIDGNPDLDLRVDLEKYLVKGMNVVKIELYNGSSLNAYKMDKNWEVRYEIFKGEESIDYMHQSSTNGKNGLSFDIQHDIMVR